MESDRDNNNVRQPIEGQPQVQVVLWDFDGPFHKREKLRSIIAALFQNPDTWKQEAQKLEQKHKGLKIYKEAVNEKEARDNSVYITNPELLKATLSILHQNNVTSIIASQRSTYGFGIRLAVSMLAAIKAGKPSPYLMQDEEKEKIESFKNMINKSFMGMPGDTFFKKLLLDFATGKISPEAAHENLTRFIVEKTEENEQTNKDDRRTEGESAVRYSDIYERVVAYLKNNEERESRLGLVMYEGINGAVGKDRPFLLQTDAELVGEVVAMYGIDTDDDKFAYTRALSNIPALQHLKFNQTNGQNALLVDDRDIYEKKFPPGMFIHAPVGGANDPDDLSYLAKVLLKSVPFPKLLQDFSKYEDRNAADTLLRLVFIEKLKTKSLGDLILEIENIGNDGEKLLTNLMPVLLSIPDPKRKNEDLSNLIERFISTHNNPVLVQNFILNLITAQAKTASVTEIFKNLKVDVSAREAVGYAIPFLIEKYAEELLKNPGLSEKAKKANFKVFILSVIDWLNNPANLADSITINKIINMLQDNYYDDLLRLETGGHAKPSKFLSSITKKETKEYGVTGTWSKIIDAAKNQVVNNIDRYLQLHTGQLVISPEQDKAFRDLLSIPSNRFSSQMGKFLNHNILKSKQLDHYQELVASKKIFIKQQASLQFPRNQTT